MALTYGFYDSSNGDRAYNAEQFSSIFDGVINDGIYEGIGNHFAVTANSGMTLSIGTGRAWFNHTWSYNDGIVTITLDASNSTYDRYDAVCLKIDKTSGTRANSFAIVKGSNSTSPVKPSMPTATDIYYYPLAYVYVGHGVTTITDANIQQALTLGSNNGGVDYVTGILRSTDISALYKQWSAQFSEFEETQQSTFESWYSGVRSIVESTSIAGSVVSRVEVLEGKVTDADTALAAANKANKRLDNTILTPETSTLNYVKASVNGKTLNLTSASLSVINSVDLSIPTE